MAALTYPLSTAVGHSTTLVGGASCMSSDDGDGSYAELVEDLTVSDPTSYVTVTMPAGLIPRSGTVSDPGPFDSGYAGTGYYAEFVGKFGSGIGSGVGPGHRLRVMRSGVEVANTGLYGTPNAAVGAYAAWPVIFTVSDPAGFRAAYAAGATLLLELTKDVTGPNPGPGFRITALRLSTGGVPPLRQFPRDDGLVGTSARQGRASRSIQASARQGWKGAYR